MSRNAVWLSLALMLPLGCASTEPQLRPPKRPEEFIAPPHDPAYTKPIVYPAEYTEQDPLLKKAKGAGLPGMMSGSGMNGPGGAGGMGGMGGPGGGGFGNMR